MIPDLDREFKSLPREDWDIRFVREADGGTSVEPVMSEHGRKVFEAVAESHGMTDQEFFVYLIRSRVLGQLPSNDP